MPIDREVERRLTKLETNAERDRTALELAVHGTEQKEASRRSTIAAVASAIALAVSIYAAFHH